MSEMQGKGSIFKAPLSCQILGAIVRELQIQDEVLSTKTAQRYFHGNRIGDERKQEIFEAIGKGLVTTGLIPPSPFLENHGMPLPKVMSEVLTWHAEQWDSLVGYMRSISAPVDRPDLAAVSYLRLAVIDLALRISALMFLAELPTPEEVPPLWAEEKGGAKYLKQLLEMCGDLRPTRAKLAEDLNVDFDTVDNWLDIGSRPLESNIIGLAEQLSPLIPGLTAKTLKSRLRMHYTLVSLCNLLTKHIGRDSVIELAKALVRFISRNLDGLRKYSSLTPDDAAKRQLLILLLGVQCESTQHLLTALWRQETDPVWRTDLMAASKPWHLRLQHVAQLLGGFDEVERRLREEYKIPQEFIEQSRDKVLRAVQGDQTRLHYTDPSQIEGNQFIRIKGDAKFSAGNRMTQYAQAKEEGDLDTALIHIRRAVELQPESAEYHFHLGATLGLIGKIEEGTQECWISTRLAPTWDLPRVEIGIILMNAGRNKEAREHLENTSRVLNEITCHLAFNLGVARMRCNDFAGGLEVLEYAIKLKPHHALALDAAAHCAFLVGDKVKGLSLAKRAEQLGQRETYSQWKLGKYNTLGSAKDGS